MVGLEDNVTFTKNNTNIFISGDTISTTNTKATGKMAKMTTMDVCTYKLGKMNLPIHVTHSNKGQ